VRQTSGRTTTRSEIDAILAGAPTQRQLRYRLGSVQRLHDQIATYVRWPALEQSLLCDARALRERLGAAA